MWNKAKPYILFIAVSLAAGGLSALFTKNNMNTYELIEKPPLSPPGIVFPIVWGILYILMGIGAALVYKQKDDEPDMARGAIIVFGLQLAVNFFWSIIFFNMRAYLFAFIWILVLLALIIWMIIRFKNISIAAAYLQIPYLLWVIFAGYLTLAVFILNR